jgi:spore maturation protein CgeB
MFKDYGREKNIDVLMTGYHFKEVYPYRDRAYEILKNKKYFKEVQRPSETSYHSDKWPIAEDFSKLLNSSKINITGGSIFNYPVLKYMEIAASKSLIFSNYFEELSMLGFEPNVNMVEMDFNNLENQIQWWLKHDDKRNELIENAYNLILEKHTVQTRVKYIIEEMEKFL